MKSKGKRKATVLQLVAPAAKVEDKWSPREMLVELLADLDAGKIAPVSLMVFFMEEKPDGSRQPRTWSANVSYAEAIAYCTLEIHRTLEDWKK